ncbi:DUF1629 domain-containing protein [Xanthomonas citri pv. citri]|uniref:DUF1629 domain-containing protein n=2 Tax=Xanthomonas citri TaxID=346 RepID=A0A9X9ICZ6_XANCI|nr:DUF1629 domain-containing protein [Xanthomonas citri]ARR13737.1 hypothetical protein B7L66_17095 [Xanthomonas citri pv. citri]MBD3956791.1 DUF1629 domain-containing protein [Xanthomonas citri pv. citri]MBD3985571.1 DUF1629 domain-containing protein [Xanthomonas citri pv. citri]MBD3990789.1 DUF1629 domain-containing protein [Xanthomonas citri pv. citri]MBD4011357.1 DUF1629 domain-containing protein [Xanthomonas citri pv. citri]
MNEAKEARATLHNAPQRGAFYIFRPDMRGGRSGHGVVFENEKALRPEGRGIIRPTDGGFPLLKEAPRLRYNQSRGQMPNDLQGGFSGYWLTSDPLKKVLESIDSEGFEFVPCDFLLEDGSQGPQHYLCDVTRVIDAIDEGASTVKVLTEGYSKGKYFDLTGGASLAFDKEVVASAHVFRTPYTADAFCDRLLRDALIENGFGRSPKTRGVRLIDASDY